MKMHSKKAKTIRATFGAVGTLGLAGILGIGIYSATNTANTSNASALSYSTSEDISFTFAPTLSIGLSTDSLTIDNLVPGTTSDSNSVRVTVSSNTPYGYVLSAGVGSTVSTDPYYNTSDLVHDNSTTQVPTTNKFSSIAASASLQTLDADNTWGYSTSTDGGTSWSTYSGLSHTATKPLLDISDPATPSTIDFKIAARSASTQASGTYNNVITFYVVGKPYMPKIEDLTYMQDFKTLAETDKESVFNSMPTNAQYILKDSRDNKDYYISKMKDGNVWMTQNLDLELDSTKTYTPSDTDVSANWQPILSTIDFLYGTYIGGWVYSSYSPFSGSSGEEYRYTSGNKDNDDGYWSLVACQVAHPDCSTHNHIGNYYNWSAAVASNDTNTTELTTDGNNAPDSICPAGWRLPIAQDCSRVPTAASCEWRALLVAEDITHQYGYTADGFNNMRTSPLWLARAGYIAGGSSVDYSREAGYYWTSEASSGGGAYGLTIRSGFLTLSNTYRKYGQSIRCLVK